MTKQLELSNSDELALLDDDDYEAVKHLRWRLMNTGYVVSGYIKGSRNTFLSLHRHILGLPNSRKPVVDHINRNKLDNRRENLRIVDQHVNMTNAGDYARADDLPKGVYLLDSGRYRAMIRHKGKLMSLGCFDDVNDARTARLTAEKELW